MVTGDFLLRHHEPGSADFVVGNPPYIRLENVHTLVMEAYRRRCSTMRGRSDIYVGFIEVGLDLLKPAGALGFICADRWMHNQYGADLRALVSGSYAVEAVVTMHEVDAFENVVSAYPAVVVLKNEKQGQAVVADASASFGAAGAARLTSFIKRSRRSRLDEAALSASRLGRWFDGRDLWPAGSPAQLALVADLEARFPPLESAATGTKVGIGLASGCDDVYITGDPTIVEPERLLPLLQAQDIASGMVEWSGQYLVNPWGTDGLVDLADHPRLRSYLSTHKDRLRQRHTAKKRLDGWYRTIDKVIPGLQERPKLLLPDLKAYAHPVLDTGGHYPHHNLYFVVSDAWDLEVLGGLLLSDFANLFVGTYCVKMRGGCYRFQAQYIRRIRVPDIDALPGTTARRLASAFRERDRSRANSAAAAAFGIDVRVLEAAVGRDGDSAH